MDSDNNKPTQNKEKKEITQTKSTDKFENIRSNYFLLKIFDNLTKKKRFEILKYNKNIQKRINMNINDHKEYSEIYSSIELEIIPVKNKYGKFININKKEN